MPENSANSKKKTSWHDPKGVQMLDELRELWCELNHWWIWLILLLVILLGTAEQAGLWPSGQTLCPWWLTRC